MMPDAEVALGALQFRSRGYAAKRLQKAGAPLRVIMQVGG